jgi:CDGSH-type Zn-finger protein
MCTRAIVGVTRVGPCTLAFVEEVVIQVRANGPYKVTGPVRIVDPEGREFVPPPGEGIVLCRCGQSANKPFCDASHRRVGFVADDSAPRR